MLLIGTVISLVTAVAATRAMLGLLAGFSWFDNPRFMGATAQEIPKWQRLDVVGRRRLWFILSLVAIGVSIVALVVKGLNLGIDFKGGVQITFTTPKADSRSRDVRDQTAAIGHGDAVVQGRGNVDRRRPVQELPDPARRSSIRPSRQTADERRSRAARRAGKLGVKNVSSSFSRQILRGAILAIIVSFALIALYVTLRYQWRFAVPILRTLVNDVLITLGVYSISGPRGVRVDGRRGPDHPRLLDLRHDHRLRPRAREHAADAARLDRARSRTSRSGRCCAARSSRP